MATYSAISPSTPINRLGRGGGPPVPPSGGGDDSHGGNGPKYGARWRRAPLGLIWRIATVGWMFVSLTSALIVRQGLPTFDASSSTYVHDWGRVSLPWVLLGINTALLLISSLTMEAARRDFARQAVLAPVKSIPGVSLGEEKRFPWLATTVVLGLGFLLGRWLAWED